MAAANYISPLPLSEVMVSPFGVGIPDFVTNVQTSGFFSMGSVPFVSQVAPHMERWQPTLHNSVKQGQHYP